MTLKGKLIGFIIIKTKKGQDIFIGDLEYPS